MGSLGASCFHTLTSDKRDIPKTAWDDIRFGQVCTDAANLADTKAVIEKLCSMTNVCTFEVQQQLDAFFLNVNQIQGQAASQGLK